MGNTGATMMDIAFLLQTTGATWSEGTAPALGLRVNGVSIDSRTAQPGNLYVALKGERFDGHDFIQQALDNGCVAVLAERPVAAPVSAPVLVATQGTLAALTQLAAAWRERVGPMVIGVTGSSGKTTLKEMIAAVLSRRGPVHATRGNLNNHIGLPLTLLALPEGCPTLVAELGMSAAGEIAALARIARPTIGVITTVQAAHIEFFGSLEGIARAKGELLENLPKATGHAVIPADSPFTSLLRGLAPCPVSTFGLEATTTTDYAAEEMIVTEEGTRFVARTPRGRFPIFLPLFGVHSVRNALAVMAVATEAGATMDEIGAALAEFQPPAGRGRSQRAASGWMVIDDTYNANPGSVEAALRGLCQRPCPGRRVAILGDMLELGVDAEKLHGGLATVVQQSHVELLLTAGPHMRFLQEAVTKMGIAGCHNDDPAAWVAAVAPLLRPTDTILVKGSRGMRMERIVHSLLNV